MGEPRKDVKYFKNTELAKIYNVSEKSVRNWIAAAQEGKLDLHLFEQNGKQWVANTSKNIAVIEQQVQKGKKYKNKRGLRVIEPTKAFYESYNQKQILDIISHLTIYNEIPTQYTYVDGAAQYWDDYANRLATETKPNILLETIDLLDSFGENISRFIDETRKVNIVDLGPGNGLPIRKLIERLSAEGRLSRYIAIDASKEMLKIVEGNIRKWFGDRVRFEGYVRDFSYERFDDIFIDDYKDREIIPANLVCLLGGTLGNFRSPDRVLQAINSSMGVNDLLIYTGILDTPHIRRYFDFTTVKPNQKVRSELILGFLNIDDSLYEIEPAFNMEERARSSSFRLRLDILVKFSLEGGGTRYVELKKSKPILFWRHWHKSAVQVINELDQNGFDVVLTSKTRSQEYMLAVSKIKTYDSVM